MGGYFATNPKIVLIKVDQDAMLYLRMSYQHLLFIYYLGLLSLCTLQTNESLQQSTIRGWGTCAVPEPFSTIRDL